MPTAPPLPSLHPAFDRQFANARLANALLGLWLFTSVFVWHYREASRHNTWLIGALIFTSALAALRYPAWRWANSALAGWLFASSMLLFRPLDKIALWNNALVAIAVFALSLIGSRAARAPRQRPIRPGV